MTTKARLLMVTPIMPATSGNGLAMRAAMTLKALAHHYRVTLQVVTLYTSPAGRALEPHLAALCEEWLLVPASSRNSPAPAPRLSGKTFDVVHLFRLATFEYAQAWREEGPRLHIDLDDVESHSLPGIAAIERERGRLGDARQLEKAAADAVDREIDVMLHFDRVYVGSPEDADRLHVCGKAEVRVLPNAVEIPAFPHEPHVLGDLFPFLFVGNLSYPPNEDGIVFFAGEVLPLLRSTAQRPFKVQIVGFATREIDRLREIAEMEVVGGVASVGPWYAGAGTAIVPIRAGGGTRIKLLEAFAHRTPAVSTTVGAEGIGVQAGEHCLIADSAADFARACRTLMEDAALRRRLAANALELVHRSHTLAAVTEATCP